MLLFLFLIPLISACLFLNGKNFLSVLQIQNVPENILFSVFFLLSKRICPTFPRTGFSGIGNQITPTPSTERRCRHKPNPFGIRRTLLPCCQSAGRVFTKAQIFEAVWNMESESYQSNVANVICWIVYNKIDRKN